MASEDLFDEHFSEELVAPFDTATEIVTEELVTDEIPISDSDVENHNDGEEETEPAAAVEKSNAESSTKEKSDPKLFQLPLTRIRNLMKLDPDLQIASNEAVFMVTRATELFIESLSRESYSFTAQTKKKTIQKRDVDLAIASVDSLMFLEGAMNF